MEPSKSLKWEKKRKQKFRRIPLTFPLLFTALYLLSSAHFCFIKANLFWPQNSQYLLHVPPRCLLTELGQGQVRTLVCGNLNIVPQGSLGKPCSFALCTLWTWIYVLCVFNIHTVLMHRWKYPETPNLRINNAFWWLSPCSNKYMRCFNISWLESIKCYIKNIWLSICYLLITALIFPFHLVTNTCVKTSCIEKMQKKRQKAS